MIYGKNFLPTIPGRWTLSNSAMTEGKMTINAGGWTAAFIEEDDISLIPASLRLTIIANTYTAAYTPTNFVDISIMTDNERHINIMCPIVDTGNGIYTADLELYETKFEEFRITIRSVYGMEVTSWSLAAPIGGDNTEIINELRGELPRLLYDYNKTPITITQPERTIALISAWLVKDTDLNGHVQLTYTATHSTQLIIRCKANDVSELFTPILYDIKPGRGSIGIPHAYLEKKIGYHTFTVSAQVVQGSITFATRAIIYTIDGGHLASRVQDVGMNVRDIALRRTADEHEPSWIYAIGVDDGVVSVKARLHSDIANVAWEPKLVLGEGKEAAIQFDGDWAQDENGWRLNTDSDPWIFWVDAEDSLWAQYFNDETTKIQLATDVIGVSVVMGWRNPVFIAQDQGVIALYSKSDGTVFYRNYCAQIGGAKAWDSERQITQFAGLAENIFVFRTNDYRVGVRIQNTEGVSTVLLTERNWAGMGIPAENISASIEIGINLIPVKYTPAYTQESLEAVPATLDVDLRYALTDNKFIEIYNEPVTLKDENGEEYQDWGKILIFTTKHALYNISANSFELVGSRDSYFPGTIQEISPMTYKITFEDGNNFNNAGVSPTLKYTQGSTVNAVGAVYDVFEKQFDAVNLVPSSIPVPEVEVIWNE